MENPNLYIIAGCNGAGKTTASLTILPEILNCSEFVNADAIAAGLSPFHPENVAIEAGKLMLKRIDFLIETKKDFAIETTLSSKNHLKTIKKAQEQGFEITLLFFWLNSVELAKERVKIRVSKGGHDIEQEVIARRYERGLENLDKYCAMCNQWYVYDNSYYDTKLIAGGNSTENINIYENLAGKLSVKPENKRYEELREKFTFGINLAIQRMIERSKKLDENIVISKDNKVLIIRALEL